MNAYTTSGQARIQPRDFWAVLRANQLTGAALAGLERQHGCQAEAEVSWLLQQNGVTPKASASRVALLRQAIGAALIRVGERLSGVPGRGISPESVPAVGPFGTAG
jgi:aryl-alcohol dehydrogenase-like predicted oxidoreductase